MKGVCAHMMTEAQSDDYKNDGVRNEKGTLDQSLRFHWKCSSTRA